MVNTDSHIPKPGSETDPYTAAENWVDLIRNVTKNNWTLLVMK